MTMSLQYDSQRSQAYLVVMATLTYNVAVSLDGPLLTARVA